MEYEVNSIPFKMDKISEQLFNSPFLSDVTFVFGDQRIYAHSLELMKRSTVFQQQLQSTGCEKKIIVITDYEYDVFYQLIRFIYTDNYEISDKTKHDELLKLAKVYNVIRFVNHLLNNRFYCLKQFDFCFVEEHEIGLNTTRLLVSKNLVHYLRENDIVSCHSNTMEAILGLNQIKNNVNEIDFIDTLVRWLNHYCTEHGIQFAECRQQFHHLIRLIRFTTMSYEQLRDVKMKYPDLLTENEFGDIAALKIYETYSDKVLWNCNPRGKYISRFCHQDYEPNTKFETKFIVSSDLILSSLVFGSDSFNCVTDITISCEDQNLDGITEIKLNFESEFLWYNILGLGKTLRIRPNITYTIGLNYNRTTGQSIAIYSRLPQTNLVLNAPENSVEIIKSHATMFEMLFLKPDNNATG